jgi:hypothetical protein
MDGGVSGHDERQSPETVPFETSNAFAHHLEEFFKVRNCNTRLLTNRHGLVASSVDIVSPRA